MGDAGNSAFLILDHKLQAADHSSRLAMPRQGNAVGFKAQRMASILSVFLCLLDANLYKALSFAQDRSAVGDAFLCW